MNAPLPLRKVIEGAPLFEPGASVPERVNARTKRHKNDLPNVDDNGAILLSEDALALTFACDQHDMFKWTPGLDWMRNRGTHWVRDDKLERFDIARRQCRLDRY